jgi:ribosome maturation factor RimP
MHFQNIKLLAGTTLSVTLALVAVSPAKAQSTDVNQGAPTNQPSNQMNSSPYMNMRGIVQSVNNNVVRVRLSNGNTRELRVWRNDIQRLNLQPGMEIIATVYPSGVASVAPINGIGQSNTAANTNTSTDSTYTNTVSQRSDYNHVTTSTDVVGVNLKPGQTLRGTITSMAGDTVTLTLADGTTQIIAIPQIVRERMNLQPGTQITARRLSNGNLSVAIGNGMNQNNSTNSNTNSDNMSSGTNSNTNSDNMSSGTNSNTNSDNMSSGTNSNTNSDNMSSGTNSNGTVTAQQTLTGTITAMNGDTVTISGANNTTQTVNISRALLDELNLRVGSPISVMTMSDGSVRVAQGSSTGGTMNSSVGSNMNSTPQQRMMEGSPMTRTGQSNSSSTNTAVQDNNSTNTTSGNQNNSGVRALW